MTAGFWGCFPGRVWDFCSDGRVLGVFSRPSVGFLHCLEALDPHKRFRQTDFAVSCLGSVRPPKTLPGNLILPVLKQKASGVPNCFVNLVTSAFCILLSYSHLAFSHLTRLIQKPPKGAISRQPRTIHFLHIIDLLLFSKNAHDEVDFCLSPRRKREASVS